MLSLTARFLSFLVFLLIACPPESLSFGHAPLSAKIPPASAVVTRFDSTAWFPWTYRITVTKTDRGCPINVELLKQDILISSMALEWPSDNDTVAMADLDDSYGASDPLARRSAGSAWRIGSDERGVGIAARIVRLTTHTRGLLVTQVVGFEHVKRSHSLFVVDKGKLRKAWVVDEGVGPTWSTVFAVPGRTEDRIMYFRGFQPDFGNDPDQLVAVSYSWDEKERILKPTSLGKLHGVVAGFFKSAEDARQARLGAGECFNAFWVLPSRRFKVKGKDDFVLAALTTDRRLAENTAKIIKKCFHHVLITSASGR